MITEVISLLLPYSIDNYTADPFHNPFFKNQDGPCIFFKSSVTSFNLWLLYIDKWSRGLTGKKIGLVSTKTMSLQQIIRSVTNHSYELVHVQRRDSGFSLLYINVCHDVSINHFVTVFFFWVYKLFFYVWEKSFKRLFRFYLY